MQGRRVKGVRKGAGLRSKAPRERCECGNPCAIPSCAQSEEVQGKTNSKESTKYGLCWVLRSCTGGIWDTNALI